MREYALNRAIASDGFGLSIPTLFRNWKARRTLAGIAQQGDQGLADLGVNRADVEWALRLPLTANPLLALEGRCFRGRTRSLPHPITRYIKCH